MKPSANDSLELFADILTITLGVTMLFALFNALSGAVSGLFPDEMNDPEVQARLLREQRTQIAEKLNAQAAANEALAAKIAERSRIDLEDVLERARTALVLQTAAEVAQILTGPDAPNGGLSTEKAALLRENQRLVLDLLRLETAENVIAERTDFLRAAIARAFQDIDETNRANLRFLREDRTRLRGNAFYLVCHSDRMYPLFQIRGNGLFRNDAEVGWVRRAESDHWRAHLPQHGGLPHATAMNYLDSLPDRLADFPDYYPVVLAYGESFELTRDVLRRLMETGIDFSWRPLSPESQLIFASEGLPPPPPL